jgi:hypothetical protein
MAVNVLRGNSLGIDCEDINWIGYKRGTHANSVRHLHSLYQGGHCILLTITFSLITGVEDMLLELLGSVVG